MEELLADEKVMRFVKDTGCKEKAVEEREEILMQNIPVITKTLQSLCKDEVLKKELIEGENTIEISLITTGQYGEMNIDYFFIR